MRRRCSRVSTALPGSNTPLSFPISPERGARAPDKWRDDGLTGQVHNPRGLGLANAVAAMQAGVPRFDASIAGLGGCPFAPGASGNVCTEDLVHMFEAMGFNTGVELEA